MKRFFLLVVLLVVLGVGYFTVMKLGQQTAPVTQTITGQQDVAFSQPESTGLSFKDIQGQTITVNPNDKTVLHFMTSSCSSCLPMETTLAAFAQTPGVQLISIFVDPQNDTPAAMEVFRKTVGATWPYVMDQHQTLVRKFHITSLDTVVVLYHGQVIFSGVVPSKSTLEKVLL